jgi:tetratricopeptide (TPR) repeat protein
MSKSGGGEAKGSASVIPSKGAAAAKEPAKDGVREGGKEKNAVTPDWEKVLYTPERIQAWIKGDMSLRDLHAISGPEMLEMAIIGFQMYEQGKYHEARIIFEGLTSLDPKESYYVTALGAVHLATENLDTAMACFNQAIKLNEKEIASYVNRGEVYLRLGKVMEAAQDFKKAVDLDPTGKDPLVHRARVLAAAALEAIEGATGAGAKGKNEDKPKKPTGNTGKHAAAKPGKKK